MLTITDPEEEYLVEAYRRFCKRHYAGFRVERHNGKHVIIELERAMSFEEAISK